MCPTGHELPNRIGERICSPISCATKKPDKDLPETRSDAEVETTHELLEQGIGMTSPDPAWSTAAYREAVPEIAAKVGVHAARSNLLKVPEGLTGKEAEKWSDERLVEYLPKAVGELGYQLKYGSDKQRMEAARMVLDATGRGKKENAPSLAPTLVFMGQGGGQFFNPWLPASKQPGVVDATQPLLPRQDSVRAGDRAEGTTFQGGVHTTVQSDEA